MVVTFPCRYFSHFTNTHPIPVRYGNSCPLVFTSTQTSPCWKHPLEAFRPRKKQFSSGSTTTKSRAMREWQDYEDAVKDKDLARALRLLKDTDAYPTGGSSIESIRSRVELGLLGYERDWQVLDTCLNADDMRLVASAYVFLQDKGFLPNFGKFRNIGNFLPPFPSLLHYLAFVGIHNPDDWKLDAHKTLIER